MSVPMFSLLKNEESAYPSHKQPKARYPILSPSSRKLRVHRMSIGFPASQNNWEECRRRFPFRRTDYFQSKSRPGE